ncbi:FkbM family methyltransferase [Rhizobium sp.]
MTQAMDRLGDIAARVLASIPAAILSGDAPAALYGMGFLGRWAITALPEAGIRLSTCYDGNAALAGEIVGGVPVRSPGSLKADGPAFAFITARHAVRPVAERLHALGVANISADAFFVARDFASFRAFHDGLADDRSRKVLAAVLETMLTGDRAQLLDVFEKDQYFALPQFCGLEKEVYVDAGAYVGDSLERFVWTHYGVFDRAIAFEPGSRQFAALKIRSDRLVTEWALDAGQIELVPAALGASAGIEHAATQSGQMTSLAVGSGTEEIRIVRLDDHMAGGRVSFLKADVEGMEMPLLEGAAETIRRHRPKLAICVYHYPTDIPVISRYLQSLVPDYRFALRHHSPQLMETVLYAWTE